jgi:hypothetical protein
MAAIADNAPAASWRSAPAIGSTGYLVDGLWHGLDSSKPAIVPAPLARVCGIDLAGTLYIGVAKTFLRRRLAGLVKTNDSKNRISLGRIK